MSIALNNKILRKFLKLAGDRLRGEWLLVGGTLLPAVGLDVRATVDIDLVSLKNADNAENLKLMEVAESLGLPVETVNQAAAFFLQKVGYQKADLLPLHKGRSATIFRPSVRLYWALKVGRLSESDLVDCQHYYQYCRGQGDRISRAALETVMASALKTAPTKEKHDRLRVLLDSIKSDL